MSTTQQPLVLVVDSNEKVRRVVAKLLARQGLRPLMAGSGKEGLILAWRERPQIIIFEPNLPDLPLAEFIQRLRRDRRTTGTPLIAFAARATAEDMVHCMEAGCDHFLAKHKETLPALLDLVNRLVGGAGGAEKAPQGAGRRGYLVVFLAAKGGLGTSSLCAHIAAAAAMERDESMALVDLSLPLGTLLEITGPSRVRPWTIAQASNTPAHQLSRAFLEEHLTEADGWGLHLLPAPRTPDEAQQVNPDGVPLVLQALQRHFGVVFADLGRGLSRVTLPVLRQADQVALVLTHDEVTVQKTRVVLDFLLTTQHLPRERIFLILNRPTELQGLTKQAVEERLNLPIQGALMYLGEHMSLTHSTHTPLTVKYPDDASAFAVRRMAQELLFRAEQLRQA